MSGLFIASGVGFNCSASELNLNEAINKSGRQRMLSQRIAKAYLQIGMGVEPTHSQRLLEASVILFDRQLNELQQSSPNAENRATLIEMNTVWQVYKLLAGKTPNKPDAKSLMAASEDLLALAQKSTVQLERLSATNAGKLVNISGRQRMLSQRMAKFYQAIHWDVASADTAVKLQLAREECSKAFATLATEPNNTAQINSELALGQQQWVFFESALTSPLRGTNPLQLPLNIATTSERILEVMDHITGLYQQLS